MVTFLNRQSQQNQVRRPLLRRAYLLALIPAVVLAGRIAKSDVVHVPTDDGGQWAMTIAPGTQAVSAAALPPAALPAPAPIPLQYIAVNPTESVQAPAVPAAPAEGPAPPPVAEEPQAPAESTDEGIVIAPNYPSVQQVSEYEKIYNSIPFNRTEYLANPSYRQEMTMELLTGHQRQIVSHRNYTPQLNQPTKGHPLFLYNRYGGYFGGGAGYGPGPYGLGYGINYYNGGSPAFRYFLPLEDLY